jgi:flavin reductase (DIM6/NTAB) family NADH-FMN oxidoreductase RutF
MVQSSAELEPDVDEITLTGLDAVPGLRVTAPRLRDAAIALECKVLQHLEIGQKQSDVFFIEVVYAHIADDVLDGPLPDPGKLAAVGRLGGNSYCDTAAPFFVERPK